MFVTRVFMASGDKKIYAECKQTSKRKTFMKAYRKSSDLKVGVIGYGGAFNMGKSHLQQMQKAGMTPVAVAELDPSRLQVATTDFPGIQTYSTVEAMLRKSDVNLVVIITPHNTHFPLAMKCLAAGRHVVSEKPLAITTSEVDRMIAAAKKSKTLLSIYHNRHWDGAILTAVDLIQKQKAIGDILRIEAHMGGYKNPGNWWRTSRTISGGILYDWGVHLLEYSLQLIHSPMTEVSGYASHGFWESQTSWKKDTNEDEGFAVVRFKSGQRLTLSITNIDAKGKEGILEVTGTKGTLLFQDPDTLKLFQPRDGRLVTTQFPKSPGRWEAYYENVRDALLGKKPLIITPEWARRPVHILDLAVESAKQGRALKTRYG